MKVSVGEDAYVINSHGTRAARASILMVFADAIVVTNHDKGNAQQRFDRTTGEALGDTWEDGEPRPRLVTWDDPIGLELHGQALHRSFAPKVQQAAQAFSQDPTFDNHRALMQLVERWGIFTLGK